MALIGGVAFDENLSPPPKTVLAVSSAIDFHFSSGAFSYKITNIILWA
jgi:hypothetical protein